MAHASSEMSLRSTSLPTSRHIGAIIALLCAVVAPSLSAADSVVVIYPKPNQRLTAIDSTFIFGHIRSDQDVADLTLTINSHPVDIHRDGGWLAFIPIAPDSFVFTCELRDRDARVVATTSLPTLVPSPQLAIPRDSLVIVGDIDPPAGDLVMSGGAMLTIAFRGTSGGQAWATVPGLIDSIPMTEAPPRPQPYWGRSVFGDGAIPESLLVHGIYTGHVKLPDTTSIYDVHVEYLLRLPDYAQLEPKPVTHDSLVRRKPVLTPVIPEAIVYNSSDYVLTVNDSSYPFVIRLVDSLQTLRHGPAKGYLTIWQPDSIEALVVAREGGWYKAQLADNQFAWFDTTACERLPAGTTPPQSYVTVWRIFADTDSTLVTTNLTQKHPFQVIVDDLRTIRVRLFGVTSDTDWIRYDSTDQQIDILTWQQPEPGLYELTIKLKDDLWGYDAYYRGTQFVFALFPAPEPRYGLAGKTIMIDPGHSADPGAIGPTGFTEADANLGISLALRDLLEAEGATVIMTREDTSHVDLRARVPMARAARPDIFISVHNNALPDGVNPFENHGVSTFYYHPQSKALAESIQTELLRIPGNRDYGLYHGNLYVARLTVCPAVLVECGFMMIPENEAKLKSKGWQERLSRAIARGIER